MRCEWAGPPGTAMARYHDEEWGVPSHDDVHLFELLTLEGAQAGLSWSTILNKRAGYRKAFRDFDAAKVARFDDKKIEALLLDPGIVRNRLKVESTVANAQAIVALRKDGTSLDQLLWSFVGDEPIVNRWRKLSELPAQTPQSATMSRELKKHGFRFVGPTVCYSLMQAAGLVNDHIVGCPARLV